MTVLITLTTAGADAGPFDLYSDVNFYSIPFEINVNKAALMTGYTTALVPDFTTVIKVVSKQGCVNFLNINLSPFTTTTTSTSSTTTTTTTLCAFYEYNFVNATCSSCAISLIVGGLIVNQPLNVNKWYYDSLNMLRVSPTGFIGCHPGPINATIDITSEGIICSDVTCPTTSTTTTVAPLNGIKLTIAHPDDTSACTDPNTLIPTWYATTNPVAVGAIVYEDPAGTIPLAGGGNWYHTMPDDSALQINGSGVVLAVISC